MQILYNVKAAKLSVLSKPADNDGICTWAAATHAPNTDAQELELFCGEKAVLQIAAGVFTEPRLLCRNSQKGLWRILSVPVGVGVRKL